MYLLDTNVVSELRRARTGRAFPAVARQCAGLHVPDPRPERDALIAATALVSGLTVVTRSVADLAPMGITIVNPFDDA